jgi:sugar lactone lactonase YvrE
LPARRRFALLPLLVVAALAALVAAPTAMAAGRPTDAVVGTGEGTGEFGTITGTVPMRGMSVVLMEATPGAEKPIRLGSARSGNGGRFTLRYSGAEVPTVKYLLATRPGGAAEAGFPVPGQSYRLAAALGEGAVPRRGTFKINERTTVAMGFSMAQFIANGDRVAGKNPGLRNAADMSGDLVNLEGGLDRVLRAYPNGGSTSTLQTFNSLADLLTICRRQDLGCERLLSEARTPGGAPATDTLDAATNIARYPWHDARGLYRLALAAAARRGTWQPALGDGEAPDAWTLALRFEGSPRVLDGPGNFAIDKEGNLWVANNYDYSRKSRQPACGSEDLARFTPTGQTYPGSPYKGGGLSGVGFGITFDLKGRVWVGNFGFEGKGCTTKADHFTASAFSAPGRTLSPASGWEVGGISWPQGTVSDQQGNIWLANCGNDSVTKLDSETIPSLPTGPPPTAVNFPGSAITAGSSVGFSRPFADAVNGNGDVFVTGNGSGSVAELGPNGEVKSLVSGGGLHLPMGVVADNNGYVWVSNSKWVVAPCENAIPAKQASEEAGKGGGDITLIKPNGKIATKQPIKSGGVVNPWGITVDGDDNVWVANFSGQRLTELCGSDPQSCPPGKRQTGAAISPEKTGYGFDGLVRNTGVIVDPSGNVWLANNWKRAAIQTNPGAYQIVAYLGLAAPVRSPQIGPPEAP